MKIWSVLRVASAAFFFAYTPVFAQTGGILSQGQVLGNYSATAGPAMPVTALTFPVVSGNFACFSGTTGKLQDCGTAPGFFAGGPGVLFNASTGGAIQAITPAISAIYTTNGSGAPGTTTPGSGILTFLTTPSSANLRAALTDEVGTGAAYFVGGALGTPASGTGTNFTGIPIATGLTGAGTGVLTALGVNTGSAGAFAVLIASGASAMGTGAIGSGACATAVTATATGTATTDVLTASFNGDPTAVTGYIPLTAGMLSVIAYPTANTANFKVCNNTSSSITPGAITLNWRVVR